jgi:hypothetical protein
MPAINPPAINPLVHFARFISRLPFDCALWTLPVPETAQIDVTFLHYRLFAADQAYYFVAKLHFSA